MSRRKTKGFTLIELLVVFFILGIILSGLLVSLNVGELSFPLSSAKSDLQAKARLAMKWITKDVRQTTTWDIANNNPTTSYIKFRQVTGLNTTSGDYLLSDDYIEYIYDSNSNRITRNSVDGGGVATRTLAIGNIIEAPFYTRYDTVEEMDEGDLQTNGKLIVVIKGQKQIRGSLNVSSTLTAEVKIRNE